MSTTILNEHDANQGAQSKGEFLGMTGNSAWYLLGSAGVTVMMVIVLWGVFEVSLLFCVAMGLSLCLLSVAYVFVLINSKPAHFDTDFFEAVVVEAGLLELAFGPRFRRTSNPFARGTTDDNEATTAGEVRRGEPKSLRTSPARLREPAIEPAARRAPAFLEALRVPERTGSSADEDKEPTVARAVYDKVKADLMETEDRLEEVLLEREEE
jgi:hypothetical protein